MGLLELNQITIRLQLKFSYLYIILHNNMQYYTNYII